MKKLLLLCLFAFSASAQVTQTQPGGSVMGVPGSQPGVPQGVTVIPSGTKLGTLSQLPAQNPGTVLSGPCSGLPASPLAASILCDNVGTGGVANVMNFTGAHGDTVRTKVFGVTTTSGSTAANIGTSPSAAYVGANIVIAGAGAAGVPLVTTIAATGTGGAITLGANAGATLAAATEWVYYGHDDTAAIQAAMNSGATTVVFPADRTFGQYLAISLPNANRVNVDCQDSTLVALASMTNQFVQTANADFYISQGSRVHNCRLEGAGVVTHNLNHGSFSWLYTNNVYMNAKTSNLLCNGQCENTYFTSSWIYNDSTVTPTYPAELVDNEYTDNHYSDIIGYGGVAGILDNGAGTFWTNIHTYFINTTHYLLNGAGTRATQLYADTVAASQTAFILAGNQISLLGWSVSGPSTVIGVSLPSTANYDSVIGGIVTGGITATNAVIQYNANNGTANNNVVVGNVGSNYTAIGGGTCLGYSAGCFSNTAIALGSFSGAAFGDIAMGPGANSTGLNTSIAIGSNANSSGSKAIALGYGVTTANDNQMSLDNILIEYTTNPTVTSGFGTSPSVSGNGTFLFKVTEGATGTPSTTGVIGMPAATNDWMCPSIIDRTSTSITARQSGTASTNSVNVTFSSAPANGDVIQFQCGAI